MLHVMTPSTTQQGLFDAPQSRSRFIRNKLTIPFMLCGGYSILLLHVFRYFLEQNRGFALKMVSDVRDGFIDANKSRTSRLHCGVHRPFYTHPRNYTRTQSATHNKWHVQYKHNSAIPCLFIFGSDCTYSSLPSSDLRFLWP